MTNIQVDILEMKHTISTMKKTLALLVRKELCKIDKQMNNISNITESKLNKLHDRYIDLSLSLLDLEDKALEGLE